MSKKLIVISFILILSLLISTLTAFAELSDNSVAFTGGSAVSGAYDSSTRWGSPMKASASGSIVWPTITSKYNEPRTTGTTPHVGIDLSVGSGKCVVAVANGKITRMGGSFNTIALQPTGTSNLYCHYEHMKNDSTLAANNATVVKGDQIGTASDVGSEGGEHLHFGAYTNADMSTRKAYRNETFYRDATSWQSGKMCDTITNVQWNGGRTIKFTTVFSAAGNTHNEKPLSVTLFYRKGTSGAWSSASLTATANTTYDYTYSFSSTTTYPVGTTIQWFVRVERNKTELTGNKRYCWFPAKYYRPAVTPANTYEVYMSNTIS